MKCFIYWTADFKSSQLWSSQLWTQFKQLRKPEKVRTSTGSRVHPVEVLTFSGFRNCLNCVHNCDDHSCLEVMTIAVTESAFTLQCHLMTMTVLMTIILAMNFCDEVSPNKARRGRWGKNVYRKHLISGMLFWANTCRNNTIKGDIGRAGSETSVKGNVNKHNIFQAQEAGVFFFFSANLRLKYSDDCS